MFPAYIPDTFSEYRNQYTKILRNIYPAKNHTVFPERNLSVNFIRGYEAALPEEQESIFSWYEFQFGEKNNRHVDAVLFNSARNEIWGCGQKVGLMECFISWQATSLQQSLIKFSDYSKNS